MKRASLYAALVCFIVGFTAMWYGRTSLATSIPLMLFVSFWLMMGFLFALHADTTGNLQVIVQNIPMLRGIVNAAPTTNVSVAQPTAGEEKSDG